MAILRPDPDLYDVAGWQALVEEMRAARPGEVSETNLAYAEAHLEAISAPPEKTTAEAL